MYSIGLIALFPGQACFGNEINTQKAPSLARRTSLRNALCVTVRDTYIRVCCDHSRQVNISGALPLFIRFFASLPYSCIIVINIQKLI